MAARRAHRLRSRLLVPGRLCSCWSEVDFRGILIADHVPEMVGGRKVGWAYSIGYIKALLARANAEVAAK